MAIPRRNLFRFDYWKREGHTPYVQEKGMGFFRPLGPRDLKAMAKTHLTTDEFVRALRAETNRILKGMDPKMRALVEERLKLNRWVVGHSTEKGEAKATLLRVGTRVIRTYRGDQAPSTAASIINRVARIPRLLETHAPTEEAIAILGVANRGTLSHHTKYGRLTPVMDPADQSRYYPRKQLKALKELLEKQAAEKTKLVAAGVPSRVAKPMTRTKFSGYLDEVAKLENGLKPGDAKEFVEKAYGLAKNFGVSHGDFEGSVHTGLEKCGVLVKREVLPEETIAAATGRSRQRAERSREVYGFLKNTLGAGYTKALLASQRDSLSPSEIRAIELEAEEESERRNQV
jgi:hypothetical protein